MCSSEVSFPSTTAELDYSQEQEYEYVVDINAGRLQRLAGHVQLSSSWPHWENFRALRSGTSALSDGFFPNDLKVGDRFCGSPG